MKILILPLLLSVLCLNAYSQKKKDPSEKESLFRFGFKGGLILIRSKANHLKMSLIITTHWEGSCKLILQESLDFNLK